MRIDGLGVREQRAGPHWGWGGAPGAARSLDGAKGNAQESWRQSLPDPHSQVVLIYLSLSLEAISSCPFAAGLAQGPDPTPTPQ